MSGARLFLTVAAETLVASTLGIPLIFFSGFLIGSNGPYHGASTAVFVGYFLQLAASYLVALPLIHVGKLNRRQVLIRTGVVVFLIVAAGSVVMDRAFL